MRIRPKKHFTPEKNWINDPNGLIFHGGYYHLYFQHNPRENEWGHMSWGHARSKDLINWEELPVAISELPDHAIFSGSVVFDEENNRLVAIYTGNKEGNQSQYISYSYDGGTKWEEHIKVLDLDMADFRDPKVFRYQNKWIMSVAKSKELKVSFFESTNLINWNFISDFTAPDIQDLYECPDLFKLDDKWVLIISTNPGGIYGGSGTRYIIGTFDGKFFKEDGPARYLDYGPDNYAGVTFNSAPERIIISWMNNWQYANDLVRETWNGQMTAARKLRIQNDELRQELIGKKHIFSVTENNFEFVYENGSLRFSGQGGFLLIDRSELWDATINQFSIPASGPYEVEAIFDAGSIELSINGKIATAQILVGSEVPRFKHSNNL